MRECESLNADLKAYLDGELSPLQRRAIQRHLVECEACKKEAAVMRQICKEVRKGESDRLDPALRARILASIPDGPPQGARIRTTVRPFWQRRPLPLWAAGAVLAAVILALFFRSGGLLDRSPSPAEMRLAAPQKSAPETAGPSIANSAPGAGNADAAFMDDRSKRAESTRAQQFARRRRTVYEDRLLHDAPKSRIVRRKESKRADLYAYYRGPEILARPEAAGNVHDGQPVADARRPSAELALVDGEVANLPRGVAGTSSGSKGGMAVSTNFSFEVQGLDETVDSLIASVKSAGGTVEQSPVAKSAEGIRSELLTIKVPHEKYAEIVDRLKAAGEVIFRDGHVRSDISHPPANDAPALNRLPHGDASPNAPKRGTPHHEPSGESQPAAGRSRTSQLASSLATITVRLTEKPKPAEKPESRK